MTPNKLVFCFLSLFITFSMKCDGFFNNIINWADEQINCRINVCCNDLKFNRFGLEKDLGWEVHGQHLVANSVVKSLHGHISNPGPSKALVLSFHGWTGSGKNFVSRIIRKNLFKKGIDSPHAKEFFASHDFPHSSRIDSYKDIIRHTLKDYIKRCSHALFVFDDIDKMPIGLLDTIKPYLDHHAVIEGVDYRKAIFIFLSNTGSRAINYVTHQNWLKQKPRESLTLKDFETAVTRSAFNEGQGGLWHTSLIEANVISIFVPFLPMERKHVNLCIKDEISKRGIYVTSVEDMVKRVADELLYWPEDSQIYSTSGCKRVSQKVDLNLESDLRENHFEL